MLILLYGPDSYRRVAKKCAIASEFERRHPEAVIQSFDFGEEEAAEAFAEYVGSRPLFGNAKLAIADGLSWSAPSRVRKIFNHCAGSADTTALLSSAHAPPQKEWGFLLKEPVSAYEFEYLEGEVWREFLRDEGQKIGAVFSPEGLGKLAVSYEKNTWGAMTELARLAGFQKKELSPDDIETAEAAGEVFPLALAFRSASLANRTAALEKILARGESLQMLFFLIASLLPDKTKLAAYDVAVKSGKMDFAEALLSLALS